MSLGDLEFFSDGPFGNPGSTRWGVQPTGTAATINAGEPVVKTLGGTFVAYMQTSRPSVGTDWLVGVAQSTSTETTTANGVVDVYNIFAEDVTFLITPAAPTTWDTQLEYDNLVGKRVLLQRSSAGLYTCLAADETFNGCLVMPLDILKHPGKVRIQFRKGLNILA